MSMNYQPEIPTFGLWYDYRNPAQWKTPAGELYRRSIDQAVWAEQLGFGSVWLSEHHDSGAYRLMDASMAVDELLTLATEYPQIRDFHYWAQFPGESIESGSERIQYMADYVIPAVTERLTSHAQPAAAALG